MFQYRITVVDDQPNHIESALRQIDTGIAGEGFEPIRRMVRTNEEFQALCLRKDLAGEVDLFLVDKNLGLGKNQDGANIIRRLRVRAPHIPVLFYSGDSIATLRKRLNKEGIEGVYCCARRFLRDECLGMFRAQMASMLRPQAVRGFLVGAVSEFDHSFREAIGLSAKLNAQPGMEFVKVQVMAILENQIQQLTEHLVEARSSTDVADLLDGRRITSAHLPGVLADSLERHFPDSRPIIGFLPVLRDYIVEVIQPRNVLAHGRDVDGGKAVQLGNRILRLDSATIRQHRSVLERHGRNINAIVSHLKGVSDEKKPAKRVRVKAAVAAKGTVSKDTETESGPASHDIPAEE
jgi:CheY-like chemotaxis protein